MKFDPINILWIEDNPLQATPTTCQDINIREKKAIFDDSLKDTRIPAIFFQGANIEYFKFFNLKLLQHPEEIKEYITLCLKIEDHEGSLKLGNTEGAVPEVVVFDYKLSDIIDVSKYSSSVSYKNEIKPLREYLNPNFELLKAHSKTLKADNLYLENSSLERYTRINFIERISYLENLSDETDFVKRDFDDLDNDQFGLYSGIEISRLFRNHPCVAIPSTFNHADASRMHIFSKYFEWINEYDLSTTFNSHLRGEKTWDLIIPHSMKQLRIRIETLVQTNKITLNLTQLLEYAGSNIPKELDKRILTFQTAYGVRHLPLDGLFIDEFKEEREKAVAKWANTLLSNFKTGAYEFAKDSSIKLIESYQAIPLIRNRIRLSELAVKLCNKEALNAKEQADLKNLEKEFGIGDAQINNCVENGNADGDNLTNKVVEYRKLKATETETNRLIILFTDIQVHRVWQNFCEMNKNADLNMEIIALLKSPPTLDDLRAALFPIPKNPLVLPYHYHLLYDKTKFKSKDPFDVWDKHLGRDMEDNKGIFYKSEYPKNISSGEKQLAFSFALDIGLESKYQPSWFKN